MKKTRFFTLKWYTINDCNKKKIIRNQISKLLLVRIEHFIQPNTFMQGISLNNNLKELKHEQLTTKPSVGNGNFSFLFTSFSSQFAVVSVGYTVRSTNGFELLRAARTLADGKTGSHDTNSTIRTMEVVAWSPFSCNNKQKYCYRYESIAYV